MSVGARRFLFAVLVTAPLAQVACGDDGSTKTVYVVPEGGILTTDDGGAFCEPQNVPAPGFAPAPLEQGACTDAELTQVLDACTFAPSEEACTKAKSELSRCASCVLGAETDPSAHPIYQYHPQTIGLASVAACMLAVSKTDEERACAVAYGQSETCSFASCITPCLDDTSDHLNACLLASLGTTCTTGLDAFSTDTCQRHYDDTTYGFCTSGKNVDGTDMTNRQFFTAVAKAYCGGVATDAGVDSGISDAGATDQ